MASNVIAFPRARVTRLPANDNPNGLPPSPPAAINWPLHAMSMIEQFAGRIAARPHFNPERRDTALSAPQCEHQCARCYMECAVAPARLAWWENELAKACGTRAIGRA